ncbi:C2 domain-containing protein [Streptomyces sp. NPDC048606]|uniref:C2 domain-containing protein n=1 Tax=Streptomyces sp. NPDC048606 TaxID=3154726 RepID=UPI00343B2100
MAELQLLLSAEKLANRDPDGAGVSDPYAKVFVMENDSWTLAGTTEVIRDTLNPEWKQPITVTATRGQGEYIKIEVWEEDEGRDDFLGNLLLSLDALLESNCYQRLPLSFAGTMTIRTVEWGEGF